MRVYQNKFNLSERLRSLKNDVFIEGTRRCCLPVERSSALDVHGSLLSKSVILQPWLAVASVCTAELISHKSSSQIIHNRHVVHVSECVCVSERVSLTMCVLTLH